MGIITNIKKVIKRNKISDSEQLLREDLLNKNKENVMTDVSQRRGLTTCSGLSIAERDYILSDAMIASAIQLYLADISAICKKSSCRLKSNVDIIDETGENAEKEAKATYILNQIFSDMLIEAIGINLLNNGEIFLDTIYNKGTNKYIVVESSYTRCTQLQFSDGSTAGYIATNIPFNIDSAYVNSYSYNIGNSENSDFIDADKMVRIYIPTLINSKVCIELTDKDKDLKEKLNVNNYVYYTNSQSLLKQIYPDWLNSKLLELAVYRDRIARSRYIQLIQLELGRTSKITSDEIYDNVKDYFDKRAVVDLEKQTFKSVVGDEPFTEYKVYTTRNGIGQLTFDNSLTNTDSNISSLADLDYNLTKVFAGLGIPKQYLGADDNGSALSNGGSLFFMDEKYQKRIISYVRRIGYGLKECIKNLLLQQEGKEFFQSWDFDVEFEIPENNEDVYRVKNARLDYANALLDLVDKITEGKEQGKEYSIDVLSDIIQENIRSLTVSTEDENSKDSEEK